MVWVRVKSAPRPVTRDFGPTNTYNDKPTLLRQEHTRPAHTPYTNTPPPSVSPASRAAISGQPVRGSGRGGGERLAAVGLAGTPPCPPGRRAAVGNARSGCSGGAARTGTCCRWCRGLLPRRGVLRSARSRRPYGRRHHRHDPPGGRGTGRRGPPASRSPASAPTGRRSSTKRGWTRRRRCAQNSGTGRGSWPSTWRARRGSRQSRDGTGRSGTGERSDSEGADP